MDNEFDFDLDLDIDPSLTPEQAFGAAPAAYPAGGAATPPAHKKAKKRGGFPVKLVAIIAAVLVVGAAGFFGVRAFGQGGGSPLKKAAKGLEANETVKFLTDVAKHGTVTAELGLKRITGYDGTVSVEIQTDYSSPKKARASIDAALALKKNEIADLSLYADTGKLVLSSDTLLPDGSLGVNIADLAKDLKGSIFDPDSDSYYALDEDTFEALKSAFSNDMSGEAEQLTKQAEETVEAAYKALAKSLKAHAKTEKAADTLSFGDKEVKVNAVTYTLKGEDVYDIVLDMMKWARSSKELKGLLEQLEDYPELLEEADLDDFVADFYDALDEQLADMKEDREDYIENLEDLELTLKLYNSKGKNEMLGLTVTYEQDDQEMSAEALWGPSLADMDNISFKFDNGYVKYSGSYVVKTDDKETFESALKIKQNSDTLLEGSFKWNKKDGDFTLKLADITVKGTLEKFTEGFEANISKVSIYGGEQKLDLTIGLRKTSKISDPPTYQNLITMDEDDLDDLVEDLEDTLYDLMAENEDLADLIYDLLPRSYSPGGYYW